MRPEVQEGLLIVGLGALAGFVPALLTGNSFAAAGFGLAFAGLFVLPVTPWVLRLKRSLFERLVLALFTGVAAMPICYFVIGVLGGPLTWWVFMGVPLVVFLLGCWRLRKAQAS